MTTTEKGNFRQVFVCGAERTGTTLAQRILCGDPRAIPVVGELPIINVVIDAVSVAQGTFDFFYADYLSQKDALATVAAGGIGALLREIRAKFPEKSLGVFKSPGFTPNLPFIRTIFPKAHFVVLRRNPLDTIVSMDQVARRARALNSAHFIAGLAGDIRALADRFMSFYRPLMETDATALQPITFVRYEHLVTRPEAETAKLAARLKLEIQGLPTKDDFPDSAYLQKGRNEEHSPYWSDLYREAITAERVGVHRARLTHEEQSLILDMTSAYREWAAYRHESTAAPASTPPTKRRAPSAAAG